MNSPNEWSSLVNLLGNVGFPVVMSGYLLLQFEKRLQSLEGTIRELREEIVEREEVERRISQYLSGIENKSKKR